ncbi:MAG: energy transducer TonB, partial [Gemmatimonadales bacterium]
AEELVAALEGREVVTAAAAAPSAPEEAATVFAPASPAGAAPPAPVSGPAALSTPTTPMPQSSVQLTDEKPKKRSAVLVGALTLLIVGGIGGGGYVYTAVLGNRLPIIGNPFVPSGGQMAGTETPPVAAGLADTLEAKTGDSSQTLADSAGQQLAANPEAGGVQTEAGGGEQGQQQGAAAQEEAEPEPPPPGRLVLTGLPEGAAVLIGGRIRQGTNIRLAPALYRLVVRADGYEDFTQNVRITAGRRRDVAVDMVLISQCETLGPSYNADGGCFDRRPQPKVAPLVPLTADVTGTPSQAIIGIKVKADGSVETVTVLTPSNDPAFTVLAVEFARSIEYNPAQKGGQPITAWTQQLFYPGPRQ